MATLEEQVEGILKMTGMPKQDNLSASQYNPEAYRLILDQVIRTLADLKESVARERATPFWIVDLNSQDLRLRMALPVLIEHSEGEVIVRSPELQVTAAGQSEAQAILSFKTEVADIYREIRNERRDRLGPVMLAIQAALLSIVSEVPGGSA